MPSEDPHVKLVPNESTNTTSAISEAARPVVIYLGTSILNPAELRVPVILVPVIVFVVIPVPAPPPTPVPKLGIPM